MHAAHSRAHHAQRRKKQLHLLRVSHHGRKRHRAHHLHATQQYPRRSHGSRATARRSPSLRKPFQKIIFSCPKATARDLLPGVCSGSAEKRSAAWEIFPAAPRIKNCRNAPAYSSILIRQVTPHVVEVAVHGGACGIVALTAEEPQLSFVVDPVRRVAAATGCPDVISQIGSLQR